MIGIIPSDGAHCGDSIQFLVKVGNDRGVGFPGPTGTVQVLDKITGDLIGSATLVPFGHNSTATINVVLQTSNITPIVNYNGVVNQFGNSMSDSSSLYIIGPISTTTTITTADNSYFCYHQPFNVTAHVAQNSGVLIPTGDVRFLLYSDNINYEIIGIDNLNGSGNANIFIPANFTTPGNDYFLQAVYEGNGGCFTSSSSPSGLSGTTLHSISGDNTAITCAVSGPNPFCIHQSKTFTASVTGDDLANPSIGSVTWTATKGITTLILGTDTTLVGGSASITVPPNFFTATGAWLLHADYNSDGYCYDASVSSNISITPTEWATTINVVIGSTNFCLATSQTFYAFISSATAGTISGTFTFTTFNDSQVLGTVTTSGPHTGFYVNKIVPAFTFTSGAQNVRCNFVTDLGGCYASDNSPNYPVTAHSSGDQTPTVTLSATPNPGYPFNTFTFTIVVHKNSGVGPLNGAGGLSGKASLYHWNGFSWTLLNNTINIFDGVSTGTGTYDVGGLDTGDNLFYAHWNGNSCYAPANSATYHLIVDIPPPH